MILYKRKYIVSCICLLTVLVLACGESPKSPTKAVPLKEKITNKSTSSVAQSEKKKKNSLGEMLYILCDACHSLGEGEAHKTGPNLHGLFGRKAGTAEGFTYSNAVKNSGIVWDEEHLRNWLSDPDGYIPGTVMAFVGVADKKKQDALIDYLKENTK